MSVCRNVLKVEKRRSFVGQMISQRAFMAINSAHSGNDVLKCCMISLERRCDLYFLCVAESLTLVFQLPLAPVLRGSSGQEGRKKPVI